ncbi:class I SAM-dependent methyltransferase [Streptacidiphilus carbonis]|uniref:class I SAM-dependent methyltransferase n=1 Tax=Streptacidiphilus carbonis TaxID=105422 RepID=UPI0005A9E1FA|nr:class I SAM-dependent methyltransferase [Streptacidiphilus carbonis]
MQNTGTLIAEPLMSGVISYETPQVADDYCRWDDAGSWLLGYPFIPVALGLDDMPGAHLVDLGCGPGELTRWIAGRHPVRTTAVDASAAMLELARAQHPHPAVDYRLSVGDAMPFLADASADAAMASFLFTCIDDRLLMQRLVDEVARVLRPGGRFTILMPNPDQAHDAAFEGFHRGEPGVRYRSGDTMPIRVRREDGSWAAVTNTYWPRETFHEVLGAAGFGGFTELTPLLADAPGVADPALIASRPWTAERERPPFMLLTAVR